MKILAWPAFKNADWNPYTALLYAHLQQRGLQICEFDVRSAIRDRFDVWHLHWPDLRLQYRNPFVAAYKTLGFLLLVELLKARGTRIVWTAHNLTSHDRYHPWLEPLLWAWFPRRVDAVIHLSQTAAAAAADRFPCLRRRPSVVVPHGHYRARYPNTLSRAEARHRLGLPAEATVIAFVGQVRGYKNVPHLIGVFRALPGESLRLDIAGEPLDDTLAREVRAAAGRDDRIRLHLGHVASEQMQDHLRAADIVVLPFARILNSGSAILALSFDVPVLVPNLGAMAELRDLVGADWVSVYDGELTPEVLRRALDWATGTHRDGTAPLGKLEWEAIAEQTEDAYRKILAQ